MDPSLIELTWECGVTLRQLSITQNLLDVSNVSVLVIIRINAHPITIVNFVQADTTQTYA